MLEQSCNAGQGGWNSHVTMQMYAAKREFGRRKCLTVRTDGGATPFQFDLRPLS